MVFVLVFIGLLALISAFFQPLLDIWLGDNTITVDYKILAFFLMYALFWIIAVSFSAIANGLSVIKKQLFLYIIAAAIKIGSAVIIGFVYKTSFGWEYIVLGNVFACLVLAVGLPIVCFSEMHKIKEARQ